MGLFEYFKIASLQISKNRLRTVLTILGIIIGIAGMITVVSVGDSGQKEINSELQKFGINRVWLTAENNLFLTLEDSDMLERRIKDRAIICPAVYTYAYLQSGVEMASANVAGVNSNLNKIESLTLKEGRFLSQNDLKYDRRVVVLSEKNADELFNDTSALDKSVIINDVAFKVIGVIENDNGIASSFVEPKSFIPINVFLDLMRSDKIDEISLSAKDSSGLNKSAETAVSILSQKYGDTSIKTLNLEREVQNANSILNTFKLIIGAIACISLIVGGIGIMNIMLVTVKERTREIGIRKACGAKDMNIFGQFLCEALIISVTGGCLGVLAAIGLTYIAQNYVGLEFIFSKDAAVISVAISAALGICFGLFPAVLASKMDTVEALRITN